jgi:hypothetical protein
VGRKRNKVRSYKMDIGSITTTLDVVKNVVHQVNLLKNLTDDIEKATEIQQAKQKALELTNTIISLQGAIMSMQTDYMLLLEENRSLKQAQNELENYQLISYQTENILTEEVWVYEYIGDKMPKHYCCPICFENGKRSILQKTRINLTMVSVGEFFECGACGKKYRIGGYVKK